MKWPDDPDDSDDDTEQQPPLLYTGEVDQNGSACGDGVAFYDIQDLYADIEYERAEIKWELTCLNDKLHGIGRSLSLRYTSYLNLFYSDDDVQRWRNNRRGRI